MDDLLNEFLTETTESLSVLDVELVKLEQNPNDPDLLGNIFRLMHTIKGTCGFLRLPRLETVAHAGENVLVKVRDGHLEVTSEVVSLILECLDQIRTILGALEQSGGEPAGDDDSLIGRLNDLSEDCAEPAARGQAASNPVSGNTVPVAPAASALATADDVALSKEPGFTSQSVRVRVDLLDRLMTLVSELVLTRNQCLQVLRAQAESELHAPLQRLDRVVSELQEGVMKTRMQPISNAWVKVPRLVRDLAQDLGKKIDLVMTGANTELDRQVLELITDPLTHMVRNSVDHGLELPEERRAAGKSETGTILLNACHQGGQILIEVADDGHGLSLEKIKRKAVENGLATPADLAALTDKQVMQYIFEPGFSTVDVTTSVSGRGVGMDVVKTNIEKIGGMIELSSSRAEGTKIVMKIPLTLSIIPALVVACGGERFALPQFSVLEFVRLPANLEQVIEQIDGRTMLQLRDRPVALVDLREMLGPGRAGEEVPAVDDTPAAGRTAIISQVGAGRLGIIVDQVFDTEEIVVKPVASILSNIKLFSGNTILADGSVAMILDPNGIAVSAGHVVTSGRRTDVETGGQAGKGGEALSILVFRAGGSRLKAVPLSLVERLEEIDLGKVERSHDQFLVRYRGQSMPLVRIGSAGDLAKEGYQPVVVFANGGRRLGLVVDEIVDIVEGHMAIELAGSRAGCLGSTSIAGQSTDIIDVGYYLSQAYGQWLGVERRAGAGGETVGRVLLVEDSPFFRDFLAPLLTTAGYEVTAVEDATQALELCAAGKNYDVIVSDIELAQMDGFKFAETVKQSTRWRETPLVGLSSHAGSADMAQGRPAGFDDYVARADKDALLRAIKANLTQVKGAA